MLSVPFTAQYTHKNPTKFQESIPPAFFLFHSIEFLKKLKDHVYALKRA